MPAILGPPTAISQSAFASMSTDLPPNGEERDFSYNAATVAATDSTSRARTWYKLSDGTSSYLALSVGMSHDQIAIHYYTLPLLLAVRQQAVRTQPTAMESWRSLHRQTIPWYCCGSREKCSLCHLLAILEAEGKSLAIVCFPSAHGARIRGWRFLQESPGVFPTIVTRSHSSDNNNDGARQIPHDCGSTNPGKRSQA